MMRIFHIYSMSLSFPALHHVAIFLVEEASSVSSPIVNEIAIVGFVVKLLLLDLRSFELLL